MKQTNDKEKMLFEENRKRRERIVQYRPLNIPEQRKEKNKYDELNKKEKKRE